MDPQHVDAWLTLARIQSALHQSGQAIETLELAALEIPENAAVQSQLGTLHWSAQNYRHAVAALEKSLLLAEPSPALLDRLATSHLALKNQDKARAYARMLAEKYPTHRASPLVRQLQRPNKGRNTKVR